MSEVRTPGPEVVPGVHRDERGPTVLLQSGELFHVFAPSPDEVQLADIAHALAYLPRFTGHTRRFYSVAQHSVLVSQIVEDTLSVQNTEDHEAVPWAQLEHDVLWALLHDAAEAYTGDLSRPIKREIDRLTGGIWSRMEGDIMAAVCAAFGLEPAPYFPITDADNLALAAERRDLCRPSDAAAWPAMPDPAPLRTIYPLGPRDARMAFHQRFNDWNRRRKP